MRKKIILLIILLLANVGLGFYFLSRPSYEKSVLSPIANSQKKISPSLSETKEKNITLTATGDIGLVRSVNFLINKYQDPNYPFLKTRDILSDSDLTIINLEGPLIKNCPLTNEGMVFCGDEKNASGLSFAGIDIATLENNHINDWGEDGINQTIAALEGERIDYASFSHPAIREVNGTKFGFLAFNFLTYPKEKETILEKVKDFKGEVDVLVVSLHWGAEYVLVPAKEQIIFAHELIDNGTDLIIGNHPHVVQGAEKYKDGFITYSHGNFSFDQMWSQETREGVIGKYVFQEKKLVNAEFIPIIIEDYSQPRIADEKEKNKILERMEESTEKINYP